MTQPHLIIVGGGLAGLSAGCYARASGYRTTIVEHNLALGGVCTAWPRGRYVVDGCIHWLTGGAFAHLYEELRIVPRVALKPIDEWVTWKDVKHGDVVAVTKDLARLGKDLRALGPKDGAEIDRLIHAADVIANLDPGIDRAVEVTPLGEQLHALWEMHGAFATLAHFRKPLSTWGREHLESERLRRFLSRLIPDEAPTMMLALFLGYLKRGWLSRPIGGTAAFRDAFVAEYKRLDGGVILHATVDEVLVEEGRAKGVRLDDGTILHGDAVISTSSAPETVLRLLGGRYDAEATRARMERWKLFQPIALASFGVDVPLSDLPAMLFLDGIPPVSIGGFESDHLYLRICNDDRAMAPEGHAVVQALLPTDYPWWATRGVGYQAAKEDVAATALDLVERAIPGIAPHVRMTDIATPLTYWRQSRSWRGAYEGWMPNRGSMLGHVKKKLEGLDRFYMAGQWVEPGGGVPTAIMSGRQAVQILCAEDGKKLHTPREITET